MPSRPNTQCDNKTKKTPPTNTPQCDPFVFLPIEPPRPLVINETYARRQHQITTHPPSPALKKRGLFSGLSLRTSSSPSLASPPITIHFSIEARLPAPPIVVPNYPISFRILLVKLEPYKTTVFVRSIQIHLYTFTEIRAHGQIKTVRGTVPVLILGNLSVPFGRDDSPVGEALEADSGVWRSACLPDTVPPSFRTCNIWRSYQLEIVLGLSHGLRGNIEVGYYIFERDIWCLTRGLDDPPHTAYPGLLGHLPTPKTHRRCTTFLAASTSPSYTVWEAAGPRHL